MPTRERVILAATRRLRQKRRVTAHEDRVATRRSESLDCPSEKGRRPSQAAPQKREGALVGALEVSPAGLSPCYTVAQPW